MSTYYLLLILVEQCGSLMEASIDTRIHALPYPIHGLFPLSYYPSLPHLRQYPRQGDESGYE